MFDAHALARTSSLCSRITARHQCALNRLTVLLKGHDWMDHAAAHAFQRTTALPRALRDITRGLALAELGTHLKPGRRKIDSFPSTGLGQVRNAPAQTSLPPRVVHGPQVRNPEINGPVHRAEDASTALLRRRTKKRSNKILLRCRQMQSAGR